MCVGGEREGRRSRWGGGEGVEAAEGGREERREGGEEGGGEGRGGREGSNQPDTRNQTDGEEAQEIKKRFS